MGLQIKKTASYLPSKIIDNKFFENYLDTTNEWISSRTGIQSRHFLENEYTCDMVKKICEQIQIEDEIKKNIKAVIVSTLSSDYIMPSLASFVQQYLGLNNDVFSSDINMACSGFVGGLKIIEGLLKNGEYGIVIGAEHLSKLTDMNDRSTAVLFGDGAGGVLVQKNDDISAYDYGTICCDALSLKSFENEYIQMDGKKVYRFAVETITYSIQRVLDIIEKEPKDIDYFISHQANEKIIKSACRNLKISIDKFPMNLKNVGNTSSASIPILLNEIHKQGKIKKNSKIILCGFGGGLTWVSSYITF